MREASFEQIARRFGLRAVDAPGGCGLRRHHQTAWFDGVPPTESAGGRHAALCMCLGTRLGLDLRAQSEPQHMGAFEWMQRLVPRAARAIAEAASGARLLTAPWLDGAPYEIVFTRESGKLLLAAVVGDDFVRDDARRALFYTAYKLRPATTEQIGGGKLLRFRTTGGIGSSLATIFPDFDLDASQDHGVIALPGYDELLVFRPVGPIPWSELRQQLRAAWTEAPLPFSQRLYPLRRDRVLCGEVCGPSSDRNAAHGVSKLIEVVND